MKSSRLIVAVAAVAVVLCLSPAGRDIAAQTAGPAAEQNKSTASTPGDTGNEQHPFFDQTTPFPVDDGTVTGGAAGLTGQNGKTGDSGWVQFLEALVSLGIVLVAICLVVWLLKKVLGRTPMLIDRRVGRVVGRMYLSPKNVIYLVHLADRVLVVGVSSSSMTCLSEIVDKSAVDSITTGGETFADTLNHADISMKTGTDTGVSSSRSESIEEHMDDIDSQIARLRALGENESET